MFKDRFISMTQFRKKNAWFVSKMFKFPMVLTSNGVDLVALVKVTPELLAQIAAEEKEAERQLKV